MAAPGDEPQTAVVPGSTRQRVSTQPSVLLAAITATTTVTNSGQSRRISPTIEGGMLRAIMQPITACAISTHRLETRTRLPATASTIAAIIGPSSSAAGSRMSLQAQREQRREDDQDHPVLGVRCRHSPDAGPPLLFPRQSRRVPDR